MASSHKEEIKEKEVPDIVLDPVSGKQYLKGRFLGKGGFAKCYELTEMGTNYIVAGKVVPKSLLVKPHQREKITQEIAIHRTLNHKHIVGFVGYFEDNDFVYILLELCRRRSLMELHKRRRAVTEPEARYFVHQIIQACSYLHKRNIIHRDLKLGNVFLNDEMEVKIGDFGLATRLDYVGERKRTLCGTPNYIAPEILGKKGHSYEVDAWSLGCIVYTLVVGKPPFETASLRDTYSKIRHNEYVMPSHISPSARAFIRRLLQSEPTQRPSMDVALEDDFFRSGILPTGLPTSCLTMAPRFDMLKQAEHRKPLGTLNEEEGAGDRAAGGSGKAAGKLDVQPLSCVRRPEDNGVPADYYLSDLVSILTSVVIAKPSEKQHIYADEALDPAALPIYWVSKWVDYSDKYGLGYQLCDGSVGVLFNDSTRLLLTSNAENVQYIERDGTEHFHTLRVYPESLSKKVTLLKYFRNYMREHLVKAGDNLGPREGEELTRLPFLRTWFRTRSAIILHLSNGTLQINFFQDHTKVILCPLMAAVTYFDDKRDAFTYRLTKIEQYGCSQELASRLRYALTMAERLYASKSASAGNRATKPVDKPT